MKAIRNSKQFVLYFLFICGFYACASTGSPGGGDYDITPPVFVESHPAPNAVHFDKNKITLIFDEYIALEKPSETVIITPPQKKMPVIKAVGKKITVELKDSLLPNITYTFDFTNGVVDNNEKNVLEGFNFAFSTGDVVDSLVISGLLLNAENLEPTPNTMVGIHSDPSDTAFTKLPFLRTSQTNERGRFSIRNIAPGTYRLFALGDINRSFRFDLPDKTIAFYDSLIIPSFEPAMRMDTIWKDSLTVDTIREVHYTRFTPDNALLLLFQENIAKQYLSKTERNDSVRFTFTFNDPVEELPVIDLIDEPEEKTGWYLPEQSPDRKILSYWLTDSTLYRKDTLRIAANYLAHDTLNQLTTFTDTIRLIKKRSEPPKDNKKNSKNEPKERLDRLDVKITANSAMDVF
ncbi:MAG: Ig-like domain-containing protein, partial [Dysgonamonadaceae bacterium]|nr:Ig-like domain-containing protein [Dysgonamonadaceae bacterium]